MPSIDISKNLHGLLRRLSVLFENLNVSHKFLLVSVTVIGCGMVFLGAWITHQIKQGVIRHTALTTSVYMEAFVEPLAQELAYSPVLTDASKEALRRLSFSESLKKRVAAIKIWNPSGVVVYSSESEIIGKKFDVDGNLRQALDGVISPEMGELTSPENVYEEKWGVQLMEIYSPLRSNKDNTVIGAIEFYLFSEQLVADLKRRVILSWVVIGLASLFMISLLSSIVFGANKKILFQETILREKLKAMSNLVADNTSLRLSVDHANRRAADLNEEFLQHIGADLHDGPAQLLALVLMRLDDEPHSEEIRPKSSFNLRATLENALIQIRNISSGLVLPELESLTLGDSLRLAVTTHERTTGTIVKCFLPTELPVVSKATKNCAYRLAQEGLNNAYRHAGGQGQRLGASYHDGVLTIIVGDKGQGFDPASMPNDSHHMGLVSLQNRVLALGGRFEISSNYSVGTNLIAHIPVNQGAEEYEITAKAWDRRISTSNFEDKSRDRRRPSVDA